MSGNPVLANFGTRRLSSIHQPVYRERKLDYRQLWMYPGSPLMDDEEETGPFLCAVAAASVNDAILLLDGMQCEADPLLRRALGILVALAAAGTDDGQVLTPALSASAIDLLVQQRLHETEMQQANDASSRLNKRQAHAPAAKFDPKLQRAIMLMIEAVSLLDQIDDPVPVTHLQLAIDRAIGAGSDLIGLSTGRQPN